MIEQPANLNIKLYPHQKVSIFNMEKLEKYKRLQVQKIYDCETDFGILGDIPGYGKSYSIVSLLLRDQMEWDVKEEYLKNDIRVLNQSVKISLTTVKKRIKTNLLVCSISIMKQWVEYFKKAPSLSVYEIHNSKHLAQFNIGEHDVVIVSSNKFNDLIDLVGETIVLKRFIFDESSTTHIPKMRTVYYGFMWLVTATYEYLYGIRGNGSNFLCDFIRHIPYEMFIFFIIKNTPKFIKESFEMPRVNTVTHQCVNPRILHVLRRHIDDETITMISAGNIKGAITKLGGNVYSTTNLIDIVKKRKEEKIVNCKQSIEFWAKRDNKKELKQWEDRLVSLESEMKDIDEKYANMLKENCSICYEEITNHTMVSCCQNIFCGNCIIKWLQNHTSCPLCRHQLKPCELSFIGDKQEKTENSLKPKKEVVVDIIKKSIEQKRKIILFSSYDETFDHIRNDLDDNKIEFAELYGQRSVRENKLHNFTNGRIDVIFLNSRFNGAGINLEMADDIILYHKMSDDIKTQVIGRALRIGRKNELIVHQFKED